MRTTIVAVMLGLFSTLGLAQSNEVQGGIFNPSGRTLSVKVKPSANFNTSGRNLLTNIVVTIRWPNSMDVTLSAPTSPLYGVDTSETGTIGSYDYVIFAAANNTTLNWVSGTEYELFTVDVLGTAGGTFDLTDTVPNGEWYVEINGLNRTNSIFYAGSVSLGPVPIQLSSFTGAALANGHVRLDWRTLSELNNYGFEVQRSAENQNNYHSLPNVFVPGHGTTNEPQVYQYVDSSAMSGTWFYRLKQMDLDGSIHYSDGVRVSTLTDVPEKPVLPTEFTLKQNYPNPFNPSTTIDFAVPQASHVLVEVYNLLGQRVATLVNETMPAGFYSRRFAADGLTSGLYFYRMTAGEFSYLRKMTILK
jgi:hypothetical protein